MEKENVWGKIRKSVVDGVTIAAEKTEEYTRLGKAKLDVLAVKRKITKKQTDLGALIYEAVKEGRSDGVMDSDPIRNMVVEMGILDNEMAEKERVYHDLRTRAESDVEAVREKAMSGVEEIKSKAKSKVERMRRKTDTAAGGHAAPGTTTETEAPEETMKS